MNAASLQGKLYQGYAQAAQRLGLSFAQYRPSTATHPTASAIGQLSASFNPADMRYLRAAKYGHQPWYCLADGRLLAVGDYLIGTPGTWFIAEMQPLLPILAVQCNRVLSVLRAVQTGGGDVGYLGDVTALETTLLSGWPASVRQGTKGEQNPADLPADMRMPWWQIWLPAWPGLILLTGDILVDDLGHRYIVSSPELSPMGWRLTAMMAET